MRVGIVGAGSIAFGTAAVLEQQVCRSGVTTSISVLKVAVKVSCLAK